MSNILDELAKKIDNISQDDSLAEEKVEKKTAAENTASEERKNDKEASGLMAELLTQNNLRFPQVGDVVDGEVIEITSNAIYLDIPPFGTGIVLGREMKDGTSSVKLKIGDKVPATITEVENEEGFIELSIREASCEKAWDDLENKRDGQEKVTAKVISANKGGLLVEINGISGFLPVSQLSSKNYPRVEDGDKNKIFNLLKKLVGQELEVRILDADHESEKLIASEKAAQKEKDMEVISGLKSGDVIEGEVSGVVDFGAFIKFFPVGMENGAEEDKLEGLVHISELAWQLIENPRDIVKVGSRVKAKIIGIDDNKISLSIRALEKDPWSVVEEKYKIGDVVKGVVHKINHFGAFVYLDKDIHGLAHISEMSEMFPGKNIDEIIKTGEEYSWKIISMEPKDHRMGLVLNADGKKKKEKKIVKEKEVAEEVEKEEKKEKE
jgi:small subunit ribosomal protein S1